MQASNVKTATKPQLLNEIYEPPLNQKSGKLKNTGNIQKIDHLTDNLKAQETNIVSLQKPKNINRLLEAYSDCV